MAQINDRIYRRAAFEYGDIWVKCYCCNSGGQTAVADLTEFEIVPVIKSAEAAGRVAVRWDGRPQEERGGPPMI